MITILSPLMAFSLTNLQKLALADRVIEKQHAMDRIDYPLIQRGMDQAEGELIAKLVPKLEAVRDEFLRQVKNKFDARSTRIIWVASLQLRRMGQVTEVLTTGLRDRIQAGMDAISWELPISHFDSSITATPPAAVKAATDKAFWITGLLDSALLKDSQAILVQAIKSGETISETMRKLAEVWLPFIGDSNIVRDGKQLTPARLETIVRTNLTDAYNLGRLTRMRDPLLAPFLQAIRFSAVLDTRTTQICRDLHGKVFRKDDADLDRLTPPLHFNCRSILTPVMAGVTIDAGDFVTSQEIGRALDLMPTSFGGSAQYEETP